MSHGVPFPISLGLSAASPSATRRKSKARNRISEFTSILIQGRTLETIPRKGCRVQHFGKGHPYLYREGAGSPRCPLLHKADGGVPLLLDAFLQGLSRVERRESRCSDLDALSGLGIATFAGFALAGLEGPESGDLNLLPGHESGRDQTFLAWGKKRFDGGTRLAGRKTGLLCYGGDEFRLVHFRFTSPRLNNGRQVTPHPRGCQMDS